MNILRLVGFLALGYVASLATAVDPTDEVEATPEDEFLTSTTSAPFTPLLLTHRIPVLLVQRQLQRIFDILTPEDVCRNGEFNFGPCDVSRFPVCNSEQLICYNRRPRRDLFWPDNRQPHFYIDYTNVYCYPANWGGCSSCSPGRYCRSEERCILDDSNYPCANWI
ncbi:predicted protein [Phaeodactylum tricornutum CCAP 1055/1]|uniref:Uncharacterized protein n=1 Tax=Phaeodactylum tricornutum (strain CCAP 1055/1) TaxID=556484 RepID=B7G9V4_PHATC|nr:predicted protein [Phaeodactylum tricornutum CCAP 1055/1]EEC44509.1 predicted protein [Phaeodactylum tricornutum CCAP 1055/1]|eukprot:XP_002183840.1 predicted protein [Phaeodactylum tricornutum CCAP 1055/1]